MNIIPNDNILFITNYLDFNSIINFSIINKKFYLLFDDLFFTNLATKMYSYKFWIKALQRPYYLSKPLKDMKSELIRIESFQNAIQSLDLKRWKQKDFYDYWKSQEIKNHH